MSEEVEKTEFVATINEVFEETKVGKNGKPLELVGLSYTRKGKDGEDVTKEASLPKNYLKAAGGLHGKIKSLKPNQRVGIIMHKVGAYFNLRDINLDPDNPVIIKNKKAQSGGYGKSPEDRASIIAQSSVKAAIDILSNKLQLEDVERVASSIKDLVTKLSVSSAEVQSVSPSGRVSLTTTKKVLVEKLDDEELVV